MYKHQRIIAIRYSQRVEGWTNFQLFKTFNVNVQVLHLLFAVVAYNLQLNKKYTGSGYCGLTRSSVEVFCDSKCYKQFKNILSVLNELRLGPEETVYEMGAATAL